MRGMSLAKRAKGGCLLLKVDYKKAYDMAIWNFLRFLHPKMGFGERWIRWMEGCVFTSSMFVIVNSSTMNDFKVDRGLHQSDPLLPFLFVLVTKGLTMLMNKVAEIGDFRGFKINKKEEVNILQFADDTIIMADGSSENLWSIKVVLRGFEMMSGLKIIF